MHGHARNLPSNGQRISQQAGHINPAPIGTSLASSLAQMYPPPMSNTNGVPNILPNNLSLTNNLFVGPSALSNPTGTLPQQHLYGQPIPCHAGVRVPTSASLNNFLYNAPNNPQVSLSHVPSTSNVPNVSYSMRHMQPNMAPVPATGTVGKSATNSLNRRTSGNILTVRPSISPVQNRTQMFSLPLENGAYAYINVRQPTLKFSRCVFYGEGAETLVEPSVIFTHHFNSDLKQNLSYSVNVELTPSQAETIVKCCQQRDANNIEFSLQVIVRFCIINPSNIEPSGFIKASEIVEDSLPPHLSIHVNDKPLQLHAIIPNNRAYMDGRRSPKPINITPLLWMDKLTNQPKRHLAKTNILRISWLHHLPLYQYYAMGIYLAFRVPYLHLSRELSSKRELPIESVKNMIRKRLNPQSDDECVAVTQSQIVSLKCPLMQTRIRVPVRTAKCTHLQCFCLLNFLMMNDQKVHWKCSLCRENAHFDDLFIDRYMESILKHPDTKNAHQVSFLPDGSWVVKSIEEDSSDEARSEASVPKKAISSDVINLCSDESGDESSIPTEPTNKKRTSSASLENQGPSKKKMNLSESAMPQVKQPPAAIQSMITPQNDVIILISDDEEEEPMPVSNPVPPQASPSRSINENIAPAGTLNASCSMTPSGIATDNHNEISTANSSRNSLASPDRSTRDTSLDILVLEKPRVQNSTHLKTRIYATPAEKQFFKVIDLKIIDITRRKSTV